MVSDVLLKPSPEWCDDKAENADVHTCWCWQEWREKR